MAEIRRSDVSARHLQGRVKQLNCPNQQQHSRRRVAQRACRTLLRSSGIGLLMFASTQAAQAVESTDTLGADGLRLIQAARALENRGDTTRVYLGDRSQGLRLRYVHAQLDDGQALDYDYSDAEARALNSGALQQLFDLPLSTGTHRLRLEYTARSAQSLPGDARVHGWLDQKFEVGGDARWVVAELHSGGYVDRTPQVQLHTLTAVSGMATMPADDAARATQFGIGSDDDPRVRLAQFLLAQQREFDATAELLDLQSRSSSLPASFAQHLQTSTALMMHAAITAEGPQAMDQAALRALGDGHDEGALSQLAQSKPVDSFSWALRDQANLKLGYQQLHQHQAAAAIDSFGRVRAQGPFSARALLGLGWAYLDNGTPAADVSAAAATIEAGQRPDFIVDVERSQRRSALHSTVPTSAQQTQLRRALVPWTELIGRNPMDPAVQEGLLAIAYALNHNGAFEDAQRFYQRSVKLQQTTLSRIDAARAQVADGRMLAALARGPGDAGASGWHWQLPDVPVDAHWWLTLNDDPQAPENFYFEQLLADADFSTAFHRYRQLQEISADASQHQHALAAIGSGEASALQAQLQALQPRLQDTMTAVAAQLRQRALDDLQQQTAQAQTYLVEARFALARSNDWVPVAEVAKK